MKKLRLNTLFVLILIVSTISIINAQDTRKFGIGVNNDPNARLEINGKSLNYDLFRITFDAPGVVPSDTIILVDSLGNFGIGTIPTERFDVIGGIRIGNTTNTNAGAIRWTGTNFEGYDGTSWLNFGVGVSADNVIGNEVLNATTGGGLERNGAGDAGNPYTLGIATGGVTSTHILDATIARADLGNGIVNSSKIANNSIVNADVSGTAEIAVTKLGQGASTGQLIRTNGTNVEWWTPNFSSSTHAATHLRNGTDELNGDQVDVDWNPSFYTPATTPTQVTNVDHLTAHLYGVDQALNGKQATITGAATTITGSNLTANRAVISNGSGKVAASSTITTTELGYLNGVTSNVQTQLNAKQATITGAATTITSANLTANRAVISNGSGKVAASSTITTTELGYLNGVTSNIQTQLNGKSGTAHSHGNYITSNANDDVTGHTEWQDNYSVRLGTGADFRMWHNGTDNYFRSYLHGSRWLLQGENAAGTNRALIYADPDNSVNLYYAGSQKFVTSNTGVSVTGNIAVTGTVDGYDISAYGPYFINTAGTNGQVWKSDGSSRGYWSSSSGSEVDPQVGSNTTNRVPRWNGSALVTGRIYDNGSRVGIGTTSPTTTLHVDGDVAFTGKATLNCSSCCWLGFASTSGKSFVEIQSGNWFYGMQNGTEGKIIHVYNNTGGNIFMQNEATGTYCNPPTAVPAASRTRFYGKSTGGSVLVPNQAIITFRYTNSRWWAISNNYGTFW